MNSANSRRRTGAFTLVEMLVVIGIIALLAALLLPALSKGQMRAKRIACESQLRQMGIAFQSFSHDHNGKFPMQVSTNDGGSLEFAQSGYLVSGFYYFGFRHFQPLAGTLETPKILVCPADDRLAAMNFVTLQNFNVSYFVGVNADYGQPMSILAGDGNLVSAATLVRGAAGSRLTWTATQHRFKGNVLFSDGHVEEWSGNGVSALSVSGDFVLPSISGDVKPPIHLVTGYFPNDSTPTSPANRETNNPNTPPQTPTNSPAQPAKPSTNPPAALPVPRSEHVGVTRSGSGSTQAEVSQPPAPTVRGTTNVFSETVSSPDDEDAMMSPFDRKLAKFLRHLISWGYLLLLLLLLAFLAYKIWRWFKEREERRQ